MSNIADEHTIRISNINICIGGVQIVNVYDVGPPTIACHSAKPSRFGILNNGVIPSGSDGNHWYVVGPGAQGSGKICRLSITYVSPVTAGQKVRGRVYQGSTSMTTDPGYDMNAAVDGARENGGLTWTWTAASATNALDGAAYSTGGSPNYCAFWIVDAQYNTVLSFDPPIRSFLGIPTPYGSGSCGGSYPAPPAFAALKSLGFLIPDGKLLGEYIAHQVGPMFWRICGGPLKGHIDFAGHGDKVTVRTPFGERVFSMPREWPYSLVIPGDLFGSSHDVVVTAP